MLNALKRIAVLSLLFLHRHPASAKWYERRDSVFIEFCVVDSKDVKVTFDKTKFAFRYVLITITRYNLAVSAKLFLKGLL